jgi:hypothetical protein
VGGLARAVEGLKIAVPERVAEMLGRLDGLVSGVSERASYLAGWVGKVADGVVGGIVEAAGRLLGGGERRSADGPPLQAPVPAAPPPVVPAGGTSFTSSSSGGPNDPSGDLDEPVQHQFGVLDPFSFATWQGGGRTWPSRGPLVPSSLARPPNDRPG